MTKDETIRVRLTLEEKTKLLVEAGKSGLNLSTWVRMVALNAAREAKT